MEGLPFINPFVQVPPSGNERPGPLSQPLTSLWSWGRRSMSCRGARNAAGWTSPTSLSPAPAQLRAGRVVYGFRLPGVTRALEVAVDALYVHVGGVSSEAVYTIRISCLCRRGEASVWKEHLRGAVLRAAGNLNFSAIAMLDGTLHVCTFPSCSLAVYLSPWEQFNLLASTVFAD